MGQQRAKIEAWLEVRRSRPSDSESIKLLLLIADACDSALDMGHLSKEQLQVFIDGASNTHALVWANTVELITILQKNGIDANSILVEISKSKKAKARYAALCCIEGRATPNFLVDEILISGLNDRSENVRVKAAEVATIHFRKKWLAPIMGPAAEQHPYIAQLQKLTRDGYTLEGHGDGTFDLSVLTHSDGIWTKRITETDLETKGIHALVTALKLGLNKTPPLPVEEHRIF